jgi:uncharacterized protein YecT (DUF1311 family)
MFAGLFALALASAAPSFECAKATGIEKAICADPALAALDAQLAELYAKTVRLYHDPNVALATRQAQGAWLRDRNACATATAPAACVDAYYRDRIAELRETLGESEAYANHGVDLLYCEKFKDGRAAYFIAKQRRDGDLDFSLSHWTSFGHRAAIGGVAQQRAGVWVYRSMRKASQLGRPCVARIAFGPGRALRITAQPPDSCDGNQGAGAALGDVRFSSKGYAGAAPPGEPNVAEADYGSRCDW